MRVGSQNSNLLAYLERNPYITQLIAKQVFSVERLASRISDLKKMGYEIRAVYARDWSGKKYTKYSLVE